MGRRRYAEKPIHNGLKKSVFSPILAFDLGGGRSYNPRPRRFAQRSLREWCFVEK